MWVLVVRRRCVLRLLQAPLLQTLQSCLLERNTTMTRFIIIDIILLSYCKISQTQCHRAVFIKEASVEWLRVYN